jgi:hypothetical protein
MSATTQGAQWIRQGKLIVASPSLSGDTATQPALDLSELKFVFNIRQQDAQSPNEATIRVYNLSDATRQKIQKEFTRVVLQTGYQGQQSGIIFDGTIKQTRSGRERNTDNFLDILASEGDLPYTFAVVNGTLAPGASQQDQLDLINKALDQYGYQVDGSGANLIGGTLPRGKVAFGMALSYLGVLAQSTGSTWVIGQGGKISMIPLTGYLPGEAVVLNSQTGLIGQPESTQEGIQALCLINPKIRVGTRIQINNTLINQTISNDKNIVPSYDNPFAGAFASVTDDGFYRVIVQEFGGDSRGTEWYAKLTCLAIDPSAAPAASVPAYP